MSLSVLKAHAAMYGDKYMHSYNHMHASSLTLRQSSTRPLMLLLRQAVCESVWSARLVKPLSSPSGHVRHQLHTQCFMLHVDICARQEAHLCTETSAEQLT